MIVKLEGKINGRPVVFTRQEGDWWLAAIPPELKGIYIVELTAVNDAGNMASVCKYLLAIDMAAMRIRLIKLPYQVKLLPREYRIKKKGGCGVKEYFELGERRHIRLEVYNCKNVTFKIASAGWKLTRYGETEAEGKCDIIDHILDVLIQPKQEGCYKLEVTYVIADETLVDIVEIRVTG